jgi:predicted lipoprotein with Yx(FWY)xxD motif
MPINRMPPTTITRRAKMKKYLSRHAHIIFLTISVLCIIGLMGCQAPASTPSQTTVPPTTTPPSTSSTPPATAAVTVNTANSSLLGYTYLTNAKGMTLYWTSLDSPGSSNVTGTVLANWPVFYVSQITVPTMLKVSDFGTITRSDGSSQTTYRQWPLYYYIGDKNPGDTSGQGKAGVWFSVNITASGPGS